ncbi:MAG: hypothetical protein FWC66_05665 [Oscillospiraceae bacterium]|nr:hypothetical protein [Oscillospiraceae bacterium]
MLQTLGIINILAAVGAIIASLAMGIFGFFGELGFAIIAMLPIGFILPILYIVGARLPSNVLKLKKAHQNEHPF